jgi:hypothetical protein
LRKKEAIARWETLAEMKLTEVLMFSWSWQVIPKNNSNK